MAAIGYLQRNTLRRIAGQHSQQIDAILGYEYGPVAVHRDDMITR